MACGLETQTPALKWGGGWGGVLGFHPMDMVMRHPELPDGLVIGRTGYFGGVALPHYPAPS